MYCGGIFYSLAQLPPWARALSLVNPVFHMVDSFRYGMLGISEVHAGVAISLMPFASAALFLLASMLMERGIGIRE